MTSTSHRSPPPPPPRVGLTRLEPVLHLYGLRRPGFEAGVAAGTFPPPRIPSRKPGSPGLWDCRQIWAVVEGEDWRQVSQ